MSQQPETDQLLSRSPRFEPAGANEITAAITRTEEADSEPITVELMDVSQHGAKLNVPENLRFEEKVELEINVADHNIQYQGVALVRHIRPVDDDNCLVGCVLTPSLSDKDFSSLAAIAGKERRTSRRLFTSGQAAVRRQTQVEGVPVTLHNLSAGGICFSATEQYEIGERVQLTLEGEDAESRTIELDICWQIDGPDNNIIGCQFSSSTSYAEICLCLKDYQATRPPSRQTSEPISRLLLTAAAFAILVPPAMTFVLQSNRVSAEPDTAHMAQPAMSSKIDPKVEKPESPAPPQQHIEVTDTKLSEVREWVDNTGKYRTKARLVEVASKYVVLEKPDGRQAKILLKRLCESDRAYIKAWQPAP